MLWSMLDTKMTKSTTLYPQTDEQIEAINMTIVHILRMFNSKYPHTLDEILPHV